mgnify:CR=1 FL=1
MIFSFLRILNFDYCKAKYYLFTSYITQFVNIIFYGILLILLEDGYFNRFIQYLKSKNNIEDLNYSQTNNTLERDKSNSIFIDKNPSENSNLRQNINQKSKIYLKKIVEIKRLRKIFNFCCFKNKHAINYLDINKDIELMINEKLGIIGNNGSGRTILFKSIINEISYEEGSIYLFGYNNRKNINIIKYKIGYCPQINVEFESMKVKEIIQLFLDLKSQKITVKFLCQNFSLENYLDTYYNNLSFGNKRKLSLLISLINYPKLLLLDDPFNSVDDISKTKIIRYLKKLFNEFDYNCNIMMASNSFEEIKELCNIIIYLKDEGYPSIKIPKEFEYKLLIKFNDSLINSNEEISNQNIQEVLTKISSIVGGFDKYKNYFMNNSKLEPYLNKLIDIINKIIINLDYIELSRIENNYSYEFDIKFIQKNIVYAKLINIKNDESNHISELNVLKI